MAWLHWPTAFGRQNDRLDEATRGLMAAQAGLHAEADAVARSAVAARHRAEERQADLREKARQIQEQPLHTSEVREAVEKALADMAYSADHRARRRH